MPATHINGAHFKPKYTPPRGILHHMFSSEHISQFTCARGGVLLFDGLLGDLLRVRAQRVFFYFLFIFYFTPRRYTFRTCGAGHQNRLWAFNLVGTRALGRGGYHARVTANFLWMWIWVSEWKPELHSFFEEGWGKHFKPIFDVKSTLSFQAWSFVLPFEQQKH